MKKIPTLVLALVAALTCAAPRAAAQEPTPGQRAAATEMLESMHIAATLEASVNTMLEAQLKTNPMLREMESVMREFLGRYMSWNALKDQYADIYARSFTEAELREITTFYRTPTGQKMAQATPRLMQEGAALGERMVQEHVGELQQMIMDHLSNRQAPAPKPGQPSNP
jgi:uncharacterized protein